FLTLCVVLPSLAGILLRRMLGEGQIARAKPWLTLVNSLILLFLCYINASAALPHLVIEPDWDFLAMVLAISTFVCTTTFMAGWALSRMLKVDQAQQRSLMFGLGMNNNGTGMVMAMTSLATFPCVLLPVLTYNLVQHLVAGGVKWSLVGRAE